MQIESRSQCNTLIIIRGEDDENKICLDRDDLIFSLSSAPPQRSEIYQSVSSLPFPLLRCILLGALLAGIARAIQLRLDLEDHLLRRTTLLGRLLPELRLLADRGQLALLLDRKLNITLLLPFALEDLGDELQLARQLVDLQQVVLVGALEVAALLGKQPDSILVIAAFLLLLLEVFSRLDYLQ